MIMITFKQFMAESSFSDDDLYLVDRESKKVIKRVGRNDGRDTARYVTDPDKQLVITGLTARMEGYSK